MFDHGFPPWGEQGNLVAFRRESRLVDSYNRDTLLHTDTHDQEARLVGEFWAASDGGSGPLREMVTAAFAWSMTPKSDCAPDADGLGCDSIRMRGYFHGPTLGLVQ